MFFLSFLGAAVVTFVVGPPIPHVHDELSYLLSADTFAHGRLANAPHPFWEHFESPHVIHQPSYSSKYPPAQGLVLALGQIISGHALFGLWLSVAFMSVAITWMLQGWLPARWALLGGVLTVLQFGIAGAWAQSYWGGAVPAAGGALMFGALPRLSQNVALRPAVALVAGSLILAFSRPFEGFVVFVVVVTKLLVTRAPPRGARIRIVVGAIAVAALIGGPLMAVINQAVTGDPFTLPYVHHTRQYGAAPLFVFQDPPEPPEYLNDRIERFHTEWELNEYELQQSARGWLTYALVRPARAGQDFFFGPPRNVDESPPGGWIPGVMILPLLLLPWLWRRQRARFAFKTVGGLFLALSLGTYFVPHYVSVLAALWVYLVVESLRLCRAMVPTATFRRAVVPLAICLSVVLLTQAAMDAGVTQRRPDLWYVLKDRIHRELETRGGRHLVLIQYGPDFSVHSEWVYNSADIDGQDVVWARALGAAPDSALLEYYEGRSVWSLTIGEGTLRMEPLRDGPEDER